MNPPRLTIGTAQLGLDYGLARRSNRIPVDEFASIIERARDNGITSIDTAFGYGEAHSILGEIGVSDFHITTKLPPFNDHLISSPDQILETVYKGLEELGIGSLDNLLLHRGADLFGTNTDNILRAVEILINDNSIENFGYSVYDEVELRQLVDIFKPDTVQIPCNIFDHRIIDTQLYRELQAGGVNFQARSIFLQGVILMTPDVRPPFFLKWLNLWEEIELFCEEQGITKLDLVLAHCRTLYGIAEVLIGIESRHQFEEVLASWLAKKPIPPIDFRCHDTDLLNPLSWKVQ